MTDLILSKLKEETNITRGSRGQWDTKPNSAFKGVADSLAYEAPGQIKSVSSVPTMWARPLIVEMALYDEKHPIHKEVESQWRGMLAAIALAEIEGFDLKVQFLDISKQGFFDFGNALNALKPEPTNILYQRDNKNPWEEIYVFLWKGKPVGMSSPSTLVCPSEEGIWDGLRWWNEKEKRILSPEEYLNQESKELLWRWLDNIQKNLISNNGSRNAIEKTVTLLRDFKNSLKVNGESAPPLSLSDENDFFGTPINIGALELLNKPLKAPPQPSNVILIPSREKAQAEKLLIVDQEIAGYWNLEKQNVWVYADKTLASLNVADLKEGKIAWKDEQGRKVRWIESKDLFLPEFRFIDRPDALINSWVLLPNNNPPLSWENKEITPLLPLNPILLDYFTPEDLLEKVKLKTFSDIQGKGIEVILQLPLKGVKADQASQIYQITKRYLLKEENVIKQIPVLSIWPNFPSETWKKYYTFYCDGNAGKKTFQASFPQEDEPKTFSTSGGFYQLTTTTQFPNYVVCQEGDGSRKSIGLILLKTLRTKQQSDSWKVGVDFGTSFSNIYFKTPNSAEKPLEMDNDLVVNITNSSLQTRIPTLIENFVPQDFLPIEEPLPLSSVLTTKDGDDTQNNLTPIYDGRIYVPDVEVFDPNKTHIKVNLKWLTANNANGSQPLKYNRVFLKNLALLISANAVNAGAKEIHWCISYPTAFSYNDTFTYHNNWKKISEELQKITGLNYSCPNFEDTSRFCTESVALAQYFNDKEEHPLLRTTCIDMGGGTSDISIWENRAIVYQCSVLFAGRDIFSEFLAKNPKFAEQHLFEEDATWGNMGKDSFVTKLDVWLRNKATKWLAQKKEDQIGNPYFQRLITLTALGTAGLYYYVGMMLKILHEQGKYSKAEITPVYIGGNGSRFLHWISPTGEYTKNVDFNKLLSRMLAKGSGFEDQQRMTQLSQRPKHEVACGMILDQTELTGISEDEDQHPFAGENYEVQYTDEDDVTHHKALTYDTRLKLEGKISKFKINDLTNLEKFVYEFHQALTDLKIQSVKPLASSDYRLQKPEENQKSETNLEKDTENTNSSKSQSDKNSKLWQDVREHLDNVLLGIKGSAEDIRPEPPFILGLKSLLQVLAKRWADDYKK